MSSGSLSLSVSRLVVTLDGGRPWVALVAAAVLAIGAGYVSKAAFLVAGAILLVVFAYVAFRAPRAVLTLLVFIPLVDRYLIRTFVAEPFQTISTFLSEGLLAFVAAAIFVHGRRQGRIVAAFRHPVTAFLGLFIALALISAVVNDVKPVVAILGIVTTIDAFFVFFLVRIIGYEERAGLLAFTIYVGIAVAAGLLALAQVILAPNILGLVTFIGRFGEGQRPGAFFTGEPNMLAAVLALAVPFTAFATVQRGIGRWRRAAFAAALFILLLALVFTFSRGAWFAIAIGVLVSTLIVDRKALGVVVATGALALLAAFALPRGILLPPGSQWSFDIGDATITRFQAIGAGNDERFKYIENALPIVIDHPVVGTGPGTYGGGIAARYGSALYSEYTEGLAPIGRTVDNYWLHLLVEFGIAGAVLMAGTLGWLIIRMLRAARHSTGTRRLLLAGAAGAAVTSAMVSVSEMLLEGNTTTFSLFLFLAIGTLLLADGRATDQGLATSAERSSESLNQPPE
jgi:O-antigen ligase